METQPWTSPTLEDPLRRGGPAPRAPHSRSPKPDRAPDPAKLSGFIASRKPKTPFLLVDLAVVVHNYTALRRALPNAKIFYAVKANPAPEIVRLLAGMDSSFDVASRAEIELVLASGVAPKRISFGNSIKKEADIAWAFRKGVRLFAFDSQAEMLKLSRSAPGSQVFCRLLTSCEGADWPLSRKFGCEMEMARDLLIRAKELGLEPCGLSFHVGSQQTLLNQWGVALAKAARLFKSLKKDGVSLSLINIGGGLPAHYEDAVAPLGSYAAAIEKAVKKYFGDEAPLVIAEPGRSLVGDAGIIEAEVILVSKKSYAEDVRWVYLDIGKFGGLAETHDEAIRYRIEAVGREGATGPVILAGPSCDSMDILYEKRRYRLPLTLKVGDRVRIHATGAYTSSYSSVGFNGFPPLKTHCLP